MGKVEHGGEQLVITRYGFPVAAVVSIADFNRIQDEVLEEKFGPPGGRGKALITMSDIVKRFGGEEMVELGIGCAVFDALADRAASCRSLPLQNE